MLVDAQFDEDDVHWRKNLAYYSTTFAGDGFVLVGDAAAFMDLFYSPGMDWISFTTTSAAELITAQRRGEPMVQRIERYNRDFGVTPPFVKNCTLRPGITRRTGVNPTSQDCSWAGPRSDQDCPQARYQKLRHYIPSGSRLNV